MLGHGIAGWGTGGGRRAERDRGRDNDSFLFLLLYNISIMDNIIIVWLAFAIRLHIQRRSQTRAGPFRCLMMCFGNLTKQLIFKRTWHRITRSSSIRLLITSIIMRHGIRHCHSHQPPSLFVVVPSTVNCGKCKFLCFLQNEAQKKKIT